MNMAASTTAQVSASRGVGLGTPLLILMLLAMMVLPLPPLALDILFTFNIALSLVVLLAAIYSMRPLDFSVFPTILLIATLLRLALNLASTRVVLLEGHTGTEAAGKVIQAFGDFVVGGNYAVGLVVFTILVIINFVVVTKGAGRVSEVSARFTLDAMPGKQMAIDADLNAGVLSQDEARQRRADVAREADFYGAMDGASKFVRGDAIAGLLILFINIIGGLVVGMIQHDLSMSVAAENYILLTIGDGLVAQIPSLLLSTATAIIVTRISDSAEMSDEIISQLFSSARPLYITAAIIGSLGLVPGMPNLVFLTLAALMVGIGLFLSQPEFGVEVAGEGTASEALPAPAEQKLDLSWSDVPDLDMIGLEVGYRLISLVDKNQGGELLGRIRSVRKKLSQDLGFLLQSVHIKDNLDLDPNTYQIVMMGVAVADGVVYPDKEMAINPGQVFGAIEGVEAKDPTFGLDTVWIEASQREEAQSLGYTVVDAGTVIATHISQLLKDHAHEFLGHDEVQQLLDTLAKASPKLVESLVPDLLSLGTVLRVMQNLLQEGIPVRDMRTIAEALAETAVTSQDPDTLTGLVRIALSRTIYQQINGLESELEVLSLEPTLEQMLQDAIRGTQQSVGLEPGLAEQMLRQITEGVTRLESEGKPAVLLVTSTLRLWLARLVRTNNKSLHVLAYDEIPAEKRVRVIATIGNQVEQ
ncbi:MAG: flagellar biosynthesis protein FlhA [Gammaproteobacteria bacterium]|jgi:flagellar biosynthesis protein FlhA|nr:flagellar biosynthesis protein FlhA [Gammaproteobacteria bacterium]MBT5202523.1 flagellar biosynthesis protein FlhA [Gammaproteobacteria bacterium]MBT5601560.1 flagellar biosynthesis protein FlhA [Gammaproteobacteria bacterium]MBT6247481.1 flagellar biosynthesis protein FlhA [Gammaproteobacteria bacterium]